MKADTILSTVMGRRTIRFYLDKPVPMQLVDKVLEAARRAPSAHNSQPWVFYVIGTPTARSRLVGSLIEEWERAMRSDGRPEELIQSTKLKFTRRFSRAPVLILACVNHGVLYYNRYADARRRQLEGILGHHSLAAAIENMMLAAHALGLGACWYSAPLFCSQRVKDTL
ncbi:MAG: nitroreductase family protein, partial [Thermoprotei archaeon]